MKGIAVSFWILLLLAPGLSYACTSDFGCGYGNRCVKAPYKSEGVCMKVVDDSGIRQFQPPRSDSVGPNMDVDGQCRFNTDCPIGFRCDRDLKACVKR